MGTFSWEFRQGAGGEKECRPIFLLSESFIKEHGVQHTKTKAVPVIVEGEEINYSKLAIKFSKTLSKDMIYAGLRDIFHKIVQYIDRAYEFEIQFSFGTLFSKEKRIRFEFDVTRLTQVSFRSFVTI
jgi:hypothetical protein